MPCYTFHGNISVISTYTGDRLCINSAGDGTETLAVLPEYTGNLKELTFKVKAGNRGAEGDCLEVGVMTDPNDPATFIKTSQITVVPAAYYDKTFGFVLDESYFTSYVGTGKYIAFRLDKNKAASYEIDELSFGIKDPCPKVKALMVSDITGTSASLSWTGGDETAWNLVITRNRISTEKLDAAIASSKTNDTIVAVATNTKTNPYQVNDLAYNTLYYFYVRAICGNATSDWCSNPASFRTDCGTYKFDEMPVETFEGYNNGSIPCCWVCRNTGESHMGSSDTNF